MSPKPECENNIEYNYSLESTPSLHTNVSPVPYCSLELSDLSATLYNDLCCN